MTYPPIVTDAAGNFLSPVTGLSFNAYKTVLEIDTMGTFNTSKIVYEKYLRVCTAHFVETKIYLLLLYTYSKEILVLEWSRCQTGQWYIVFLCRTTEVL